MDWALHDPVHGAYGAGRLRVGPAGDFATSPSLGPDFAELLLPQLLQWFQQQPAEVPLALIETGPGEGHLALQLAQAIAREAPELVGRLELVLVEPNPGMAERQRGLLADAPLRCRWQSFAELHANPRSGVVLAHEVLDALAVERVIRVNGRWCLQGVAGDRHRWRCCPAAGGWSRTRGPTASGAGGPDPWSPASGRLVHGVACGFAPLA